MGVGWDLRFSVKQLSTKLGKHSIVEDLDKK